VFEVWWKITEEMNMENMWIYGIGFSFIHIGYSDLMKMNKSGIRGLNPYPNIIFELLGGVSYVLFLIWGFFVFDWWVPIVITLVCIITASFLSRFIFNIPHIFVLIGISCCLYALLIN